MSKYVHKVERGIYVDTFVRILGHRGLVIPWQYREILARRGCGAEVVVAKGCGSPHLACYAPSDKAKIRKHVRLLRTQHPDNTAIEPFLVTLTMDKRGRIKLPEEFRQYAELAMDSEVFVSGVYENFEVWLPSNLVRALTKSPVINTFGA